MAGNGSGSTARRLDKRPVCTPLTARRQITPREMARPNAFLFVGSYKWDNARRVAPRVQQCDENTQLQLATLVAYHYTAQLRG